MAVAGNEGSTSGQSTTSIPGRNRWDFWIVVAMLVAILISLGLILNKFSQAGEVTTILGVIIPSISAIAGAAFGVAIGQSAGEAKAAAAEAKSATAQSEAAELRDQGGQIKEDFEAIVPLIRPSTATAETAADEEIRRAGAAPADGSGTLSVRDAAKQAELAERIGRIEAGLRRFSRTA